MLDYEGEAPVGGRMYDAACPDPSEAGAMSASLWELTTMAAHHYHPHVVQAASSLLGMALGSSGSGNLSGPLAMAGSTRELADAYDSSKGAFRPAPALPKANRQGLPSSMLRRLQQAAGKSATSSEMQLLLESCGEDLEMDDAEGSLFHRHALIIARYDRNKVLRKEKAGLIRRLHKFNEHLSSKHGRGDIKGKRKGISSRGVPYN